MLRVLYACAMLAFALVALLIQGAAPAASQVPANSFTVFVPFVRRDFALSPSLNLPANAATYLGGAGSDAANAVDIALDGSVVLAGSMPGFNPGNVPPIDLLGGGNGVVLRLSSDGQEVSSITRIGGVVNDLEIGDDGRIVVCGDFGVAVLSSDASTLIWNANPGTASRCALGSDGSVAALVGGAAYVYNALGNPLQNWNIGGNAQNDIAVAGGQGLVIATGYVQVSSNLQVAFIRAWSYDGTLRWRSYDFASAPGLGADTRGERIAIGRDGLLYFAGSINGGTGASIFSRDPKNIDTRLGSDRNIATDSFNNPTNTGSVKMTWYGRYDPATGNLLRGSSLLTRLSSGSGNSIVAKAITADEDGRIYLAGDSSCCIEQRGSRQVAGTTVGNYEAGETFFLAVSEDFRQRLIWTPFAAPGVSAGGSPANGVAVRNRVVAVAATLNSKTGTNRGWITRNALQASPATLPDAYLVLWRQGT